MKFGKKCILLFSHIDSGLLPLPYKQLKKNMKVMASFEFFAYFAYVIERLNSAWLKAVDDLKVLCVFYKFHKEPTKVYKLLSYAQLCREGVRKLLKKYNKKNPQQFWTVNRQLHFVNSITLQRLKDFAFMCPLIIERSYECPVCLQLHVKVTKLVCNHTLCLHCYQQISTDSNNNLTNRRDIETTAPRCPMCRQPLLRIA